MSRFLVVLLLLAGTSSVVAEAADPATLILDKPLLFSSADGAVIRLAPERYVIEVDGDNFRLSPDSGKATLVPASGGDHELAITETLIRAVPNDDETGYLLLALLPDGESRYTTGTDSGLRTRSAQPVGQVYTVAVPVAVIAPINLAYNKDTNTSSWLIEGVPSLAVDGNTNGNFQAGSVTQTEDRPGSWWEVDLANLFRVERIEIWNRTDCCAERLDDFTVTVTDDISGASTPFFNGAHQYQSNQPNPLVFTGNATGNLVRIQLQDSGILSLAEVRVFGQPVNGLPPGDYTLKLKSRNRYAEKAYWSGSVVVTRNEYLSDAQPWTVTPIGAGVYTVRRGAGNYLDARTNLTALATTGPAESDGTQFWIMRPVSAGAFTLEQQATGFFLEAGGDWATNPDGQLRVGGKRNNDTQRWIIEPYVPPPRASNDCDILDLECQAKRVSPIDVAKTPTGAAPVPVPYPTNTGGKTKTAGKTTTSTKPNAAKTSVPTTTGDETGTPTKGVRQNKMMIVTTGSSKVVFDGRTGRFVQPSR